MRAKMLRSPEAGARSPSGPDIQEFFSEYQPKLKNYAANIIGQSYAEELAQETMIIVARRWDHVSFPARYSFTIMNRLCDRLRQGFRQSLIYSGA